MRARVGPEVQLTFDEPYLLDPAMETPGDALIVTSLGDARQQECSGSKGSAEARTTVPTEASWRALGIQTVICGPGDIAQAHTENEFVEIEQVELADAIYGCYRTDDRELGGMFAAPDRKAHAKAQGGP